MVKNLMSVFLLLTLSFTVFAQVDSSAVDSSKVIGYDASGTRPYPFTAGDALKITLYPDTNMFPSGVYLIDGEGYTDLPVIGYLKVTDKSATELEALFKEKYLQFMRFPILTVRPLMRVSLFGGFTRPGLYYLDPHVTMWDAVRYAGVTTRRDGLSKITWERDHAVINKDVVPLFQSQKSLYQIGFRSGDRLTVTQAPEKTHWEVFRADMLPMLTFVMSTALQAATLYSTYNYLKEARK